MTDLRVSFPVLEDSSTQAGLPLHKVLEGVAASGKNALAALIAKDPSGNLIYPVTNALGELVVSTQSASVALLANANSHAGSTSNQVVATITLQTDHVYRNINYHGSSFRDTIFDIVQIDDATTSVLRTFRVGSGGYDDVDTMGDFEFTSGSTGTQTLLIRARNLTVASTMDADVSVDEVQ